MVVVAEVSHDVFDVLLSALLPLAFLLPCVPSRPLAAVVEIDQGLELCMVDGLYAGSNAFGMRGVPLAPFPCAESVRVVEDNTWDRKEEFPSVAGSCEVVVVCVVYDVVASLLDELGVNCMALRWDGFGGVCISQYIAPRNAG